MTSKSVTLDSIRESFERVGAEYVGSLVAFNVGGIIRLPELIANMTANPKIPKSWVPRMDTPDALFWKVAKSCQRSTLRTFNIPNPDEIDSERHGGYRIDKVSHDVTAEYPVVLRAHLRLKNKTDQLQEAKGRTVNDIEYDDSILIALHRVSGDPSLDKLGQSTFEISINTDGITHHGVVDQHKLEQFKPLIKTVTDNFDEAISGVMTSDQIRSMLLDIVKTKSSCYSVLTGLYLALPDDMEKFDALSNVMSSINECVRIVNIPIPKYKNEPIDSPLNQQVREVRLNFTEEFLKDLKSLNEELDELIERDAAEGDGVSKVQSRTWTNRATKLKQLKSALTKYSQRDLLLRDMADELLDEISGKLKTKLL